jgi:hypothetical protein
MPNQKVPQLPVLSAVTGEDLFYVVDVSDTTDDPTGSSKQISRDNILQNITGLTATTISATTYQNLPTDVFVTGGTYTSGNAIFTNNTGGTFTVSGFTVGGGGGQIFYLNLSQSQNGNRLLSTTASTASEQTSGVTINNGVTDTIASFQSQPLNIILLPGGIWSFYLHSYKENTNASFNIFVELYKITSGGTQTLLFATDPTPVTTNSPNPSMQLTDGYFSGTSLDVSDSIVATVRATNTDNQSHTITLVTEGSTHYSYVVSTIPTQQGLTCDTLSGCSVIQTIQTNISNKFDKSGGTINGDLTVTGNTSLQGVTATTISATTISATTYYGSGTNLTGVVKGSGTNNYLPRWTGTTGLGNSIIQDNGTNIGIGTSPGSDKKVTIFTVDIDAAAALWVRNGSSNGGSGIYAISDSGKGSQVGVTAMAQGHQTTGTSIGFQGFATNGLLGIGVYGQVGVSESNTMTTGIGGYFNARGDGEFGYPTTSYGLQVIDGTEGVDKILQSKTSDGKTNWVDPLTVQTAFNYGLANAIMTGNFLT